MAKAGYNPEVLKPKNRELAILGLCSVLDASYVVYCHWAVGARGGLTALQYKEGLEGRVPPDLSEEEETAYALGRKLTSLNGPLDEESWQVATSKMTKTEIIGIVLGNHRRVSMCCTLEENQWRRRTMESISDTRDP